MASPLLVALGLALATAPEAPVPPRPPVAETPVVPHGSTPTPTPTPTSTSTATPTPTATATPTPAATPTPTPTATSTPTAPSTAAATPRLPLKAEAEPPRHTPRSLSGAALADELRDASRRRQQELSAIRSERERLEKLREEIEASRKALREETARLDERVKAAQEVPPPKANGTPAKPSASAAASDARDGKGPVDALAKTLKGMKPDQAAGVIARLDKPLAVELLRRMRPGDAAALLERMKPEAAADFFVQLAGARR